MPNLEFTTTCAINQLLFESGKFKSIFWINGIINHFEYRKRIDPDAEMETIVE